MGHFRWPHHHVQESSEASVWQSATQDVSGVLRDGWGLLCDFGGVFWVFASMEVGSHCREVSARVPSLFLARSHLPPSSSDIVPSPVVPPTIELLLPKVGSSLFLSLSPHPARTQADFVKERYKPLIDRALEMLEVYRSSSVDWKPSPVVALAPSVDDSQVTAAREDGSVEIWLVSPGSVGWHRQLTIHGNNNSRFSSLAWCRSDSTGLPSGRLFSSSIDGSVSEWDLFDLK